MTSLVALFSAYAFAQRCAGVINIGVLETSSGGNVFAGVGIPFDSSGDYHAGRMTSLDGRYEMTAFRYNRRKGIEPFASLAAESKRGYQSFDFGCDGDYLLRIVRTRGAMRDTMNVRVLDACDAVFGMNLIFSPGTFEARLCDTTARSEEREGKIISRKFRPPAERYTTFLYGGLDVTAMVEQDRTAPGRSLGDGATRGIRDVVVESEYVLRVGNWERRSLDNATVIVRLADGVEYNVPWDTVTRAYPLPVADLYDARITASCPGYIERTIVLKGDCHLRSRDVSISLARLGEDLYHQSCSAIPFIARRDLIFIVPRISGGTARVEFEKFITESGLVEVDAKSVMGVSEFQREDALDPKSLRDYNVRLYRKADGSEFDRDNDATLAVLAGSSMIRIFGTPKKVTRSNIDGFDYQMFLQPDRGVQPEVWMRALREVGIEAPPHSSGGGFWMATPPAGTGVGVCGLIERLLATGMFTSIENNGFTIVKPAGQ